MFERGVIVYGVLVGPPAYVSHKLRERAKTIAVVLRLDRQALWSALN